MNTTFLAVLCSRVAEEPSLDEPTRDKARNLKREWSLLQTAPLPNLRAEQEQDAKREENHRKLAEFLVDVISRM